MTTSRSIKEGSSNKIEGTDIKEMAIADNCQRT